MLPGIISGTWSSTVRTVPGKTPASYQSSQSPEIARMQMEAGEVVVLTTATVWEAVVMVRAGIADILIANEVVGPEKI